MVSFIYTFRWCLAIGVVNVPTELSLLKDLTIMARCFVEGLSF